MALHRRVEPRTFSLTKMFGGTCLNVERNQRFIYQKQNEVDYVLRKDSRGHYSRGGTLIYLLTSRKRYGLELRMTELPKGFLDLAPAAKLLYIFLLDRQETSWSHAKLERCLGARAKNILVHASVLDELELIKYTPGVGAKASAGTPPKLKVTKEIMRVGRLQELPDTVLGQRIMLKLIWLYLARSGLTLTTPEIKTNLGLSRLATVTALKDLNQLGLVETTGKKPLSHKAVANG